MVLKHIWRVLWRRKWSVVLVASAVLAVFVAACFLFKPVYKVAAKARILQVVPDLSLLPNLSTDITELQYSGQQYDWALKTLSLLFESQAASLVKELGLKDAEGNPLKSKDLVDSGLLSIIRKRIGSRVDVIPDTDVFEIAGYAATRELALEIARRLAAKAQAAFADWYRGMAAGGVDLLTRSRDKLEAELRQVGQEIRGFRSRTLVIDYDTQVNRLLARYDEAEESLRNIEISYQVAREAEAVYERMIAALPEFRLHSRRVERNPAVEQVVAEILSLERRLAGLRVTLKAGQPRLREVEVQLAEARKQRDALIEKTLDAETEERFAYVDTVIQKKYDGRITLALYPHQKRLQEQARDEIRKQLAGLPERQEKLAELLRRRDNVDAQYRSVFAKLESAKLLAQLPLTNLRVFQEPTLAENPEDDLYFPKKGLLMVLGVFVGGFFGLAAAFLREYMDTSVRGPEHLREHLDGAAVAAVGHVSARHAVGADPESPLAESARAIRLVLGRLGGGDLPRSVAVVGARRGDGRTTLAVPLAAALAELGRRTCLVDLDLAHPTVLGRLGLTAGGQLAGYLDGSTSLDDAVRDTPIPALSVLGNDRPLAGPLAVLSRPEAAGRLTALADRFDAIVLDGPPLERREEALVVVGVADAVVCVVRAEATALDEAVEAYRTLVDAGRRPVMVVNDLKRYLW